MGAPANLLKDLRGFRRRLEAEVGPVRSLVLFGSQASGRAGLESDVDVLVVSPAFAGKTYLTRAAQAWDCWNLPHPVDFLCYTPDEFDRLRREASIVREALKEGVEVEA